MVQSSILSEHTLKNAQKETFPKDVGSTDFGQLWRGKVKARTCEALQGYSRGSCSLLLLVLSSHYLQKENDFVTCFFLLAAHVTMAVWPLEFVHLCYHLPQRTEHRQLCTSAGIREVCAFGMCVHFHCTKGKHLYSVRYATTKQWGGKKRLGLAVWLCVISTLGN